MSLLARYLSHQQFCVLFEYLTSKQSQFPLRAQFAGFPVCMTLADRVHADDDAAPLDISKLYPEHVEKLIHYSGKGRDIQDFVQFLHQAKSQGRKTYYYSPAISSKITNPVMMVSSERAI